jgi:hypothetical protein
VTGSSLTRVANFTGFAAYESVQNVSILSTTHVNDWENAKRKNIIGLLRYFLRLFFLSLPL